MVQQYSQTLDTGLSHARIRALKPLCYTVSQFSRGPLTFSCDSPSISIWPLGCNSWCCHFTHFKRFLDASLCPSVWCNRRNRSSGVSWHPYLALTCCMTVVDTVNALTRSPWSVPKFWCILASDSLHLWLFRLKLPSGKLGLQPQSCLASSLSCSLTLLPISPGSTSLTND